jgi:hypothetical protein
VQPLGRDLDAMGLNLMAGSNRNQVIAVARETVAEQLAAEQLASKLAELPGGDPAVIRRPPGPSSEWPDLDALGSRVGSVAG